ncbi:MAG: tetratricopeptide repeat protein [Paludisphaera borealis]|uniref:tetratricopeptide repeat protein n=1 Tax=Paludisphaera borealis TaxID=1387353 RepID=UPI002851BC2F|nr:tetratricopeptide repeat protein [Paludisphaera borealis]MDR3623357.1 tetratricopeptide repeat protein [Paludisphaera borealis]
MRRTFPRGGSDQNGLSRACLLPLREKVAEGRMRGGVHRDASQAEAVNHPSSAAARHLLPQGEKGACPRLERKPSCTAAHRPILLAAGLVLALAVLGGPSTSPAQTAPAADTWIGRRVITKYGTVLRVDGKPVDDEGRGKYQARGKEFRDFRIYSVEQVDGASLLLADEDSRAKGWGHAGDVIPFDQAIDYISGLIRADPDASSYDWRGCVLRRRMDFDLAIADFNEAIRLEPGEACYYYNRGKAWNARQDYEKAIADFDKAICLDPEEPDAYTNRADAQYAKKDYEKAVADYSEAIRREPGDVVPYNNRGNTRFKQKDYEKALIDYNEAIRLDPMYIPPYLNRGGLWSAKAEYAKAIADYDEVVRLDPRNETAFDRRAWLWATAPDEKARDGKRAVESATRACELAEWKTPDRLDTLAAACAEAGDFDVAMKWQEKAIGLLDKQDEAETADYRERLELYRDKKPYRQEPTP